jgi:hypothetical protein
VKNDNKGVIDIKKAPTRNKLIGTSILNAIATIAITARTHIAVQMAAAIQIAAIPIATAIALLLGAFFLTGLIIVFFVTVIHNQFLLLRNYLILLYLYYTLNAEFCQAFFTHRM